MAKGSDTGGFGGGSLETDEAVTGAPSGWASLWEYRAAQNRQAHAEESPGASSIQGHCQGGHFDHGASTIMRRITLGSTSSHVSPSDAAQPVSTLWYLRSSKCSPNTRTSAIAPK